MPIKCLLIVVSYINTKESLELSNSTQIYQQVKQGNANQVAKKIVFLNASNRMARLGAEFIKSDPNLTATLLKTWLKE